MGVVFTPYNFIVFCVYGLLIGLSACLWLKGKRKAAFLITLLLLMVSVLNPFRFSVTDTQKMMYQHEEQVKDKHSVLPERIHVEKDTFKDVMEQQKTQNVTENQQLFETIMEENK